MAIKITVNGVDYPSVEAMPPDARKIYEELRARFPNVLIGGEVPETIASKDFGPFHLTASVRRNIVVNEKTTHGPASARPDASTGSPTAPLLSMVRPIEPTGAGLPLRFAYGAAVGVAVVLAWWWLSVH